MSPVEELMTKLFRPARVLLVEDDRDIAECFCMLLDENYVCDLQTVATGTEAVAVLAVAPRFDIIFLNLVLPEISGLEVLRVIKKSWPDVPVVVVTGFTQSELAREASMLGVVGVIGKPFTAQDLDHIFRTYRIRVREKSDQPYFDSISTPAMA